MLITACTSCHTAFRITREQLTARAAQVRCGQCQTVFDALVTLRNDDLDSGLQAHGTHLSSTPTADHPTSGANSATPSEMRHVEPDAASPATAVTEPALAQQQREEAAAKPALPAAAARRSAQIFEPEPPAPVPTEDSTTSAHPAMGTTASTEPVETARSDSPSPSASTSPNFDFGPQAKVQRAWWWLPSAFLLFLALLAQSIYYFRGAIAVTFPEVKPYIVEICAELGCDVPLPKRVELLGIESSDLQADPARPGVMVLSATLRNRAAFPQAFPALEFTLTNERDMALARRVLLPTDYLPNTPEAFEGSSERQVRVSIEAGALKASGYRLYLFFP